MQIKEIEIKKIFAKILKTSISKVDDKLSMHTNEKWDSLSHLKLIIAIEGKLKISFDDQIVAQLISYKLIKLQLLKSKIKFSK